MLVYLAKDANKPQFKIGKANVVCDRLSQIADLATFDLQASHCIRLPSSEIAYKIESAIHHLFAPWNIEPDKNQELKNGHTEWYKIECYDRVLDFLYKNPDLVFGAVPEPIPAPTEKARPPRRSPEQRLRDKELREKEEQIMKALNLDLALIMFRGVAERLLEIQPDVFELCEHPDEPRPSLYVESSNREEFDRVVGMVSDLTYLNFNPKLDPDIVLRASVVGSVCARWDRFTGRGRMSATLTVPVTNANRYTLNAEYVRIYDMIPRSQVLRESVEISISPSDDEDVYVPTMP